MDGEGGKGHARFVYCELKKAATLTLKQPILGAGRPFKSGMVLGKNENIMQSFLRSGMS